MSSSVCFLCHSTVNSETSEDIRDKFKEVVGMHLSLQLCHVCCHLVRKLHHFRATCLKRSLEYPVLFSEKGTLNLQRNDMETFAICSEEECQPPLFSTNFYVNSKVVYLRLEQCYEDSNQEYCEDAALNQYVDLEHKGNAGDTRLKAEEYEARELTDSLHGDASDLDYLEESANELKEEAVELEQDGMDSRVSSEAGDGNVKIEQSDVNTETIDHDDASPAPKKRKKKAKKDSFKKIVLTFQEQRAVLEAQRRDKKYLEAMFKCHSCALGFPFQDTYQSHMVRHEESNGQFNCNVCGLRFATQNARSMHVNLHAEIYRCNRCSAEVKRPHRGRHSRDCWHGKDGAHAASCHLCGKQFKDGNCLQQHVRRFHAAKSSSRVYPCSVCGKTYPDPGVLRTHMIKHSNCRFACRECGASFASPYSLSRHRRKHAAPPAALHHCALCGTSYETRKSLAAHLRNTLRHQQMVVECGQCQRKFPTRHALRRHAETHGAPRDCALCGARCRSRAALRRHSAAHVRPPPTAAHVCHICGKGFKCKSKLTRHVREVCEKSKMEEEMAAFYEQESVLEQIQAVVGT